MKVNRRSDNRGATLILDEIELEYLWHRLNCADHYPFEDYEKDENFNSSTNSDALFNDLDKKYRPKDQ